MPLSTLGSGTGYLKAGMLGFQKSGKTYTSALLAIGLRQFMKLDGPVAMFDTETGSEYIAPMILKATGKPLLGKKARSFTDLMQFANDCVAEKVSVALVDSVTHPWRELCDAYLVQLNDRRAQSNKSKLMKLEFQHWSAIKGIWQSWTDFYINSPLHIIICGRAGFEWDMQTNEDNRKELVKTGIKMRVESEFGFEPSLLVEMERQQVEDKDGKFQLQHVARVLGDRFNVIDGNECVNPTFEFFKPHIALLSPGVMNPVDTKLKTATGADEEGDAEWQRERRTRTILCEEIQGAIVSKYPGQSAEEKKIKGDLLAKYFGTRSWTAVENIRSEMLRGGLYMLKKDYDIDQPPPVSHPETDDGDLGPVAKKASGNPPEPPKSNLPPTRAASTPLKGELTPLLKVRFLLETANPKITERQLLDHLGELGTAPKDIDSLEELSLLAPETIRLITDQWPMIHEAAVIQFGLK